jgi:drug/metabolite transporter (DMT)-like permease
MSPLLPALALTTNALIWGTSWWPLRYLRSQGLHPLWATALVLALAGAVVLLLRPRALGQVLRTPALWVVVLAAGTSNSAFNWGVVIGDVVRVILLFYLMPIWAVLLARLLLHERLTWMAGVRVLLALSGAAIVLWPAGATGLAGLPLPSSLADWLGVIGGMGFALNNVMLRRVAHEPEEGRALAMFIGGALISSVLATALTVHGAVPAPPPPDAAWVFAALGLALLFLFGNLTLQYGAARLPANVTAVVMLTEVLFASSSALALGGAQLSLQLVLGGSLILFGAALAALQPAR